MGEFNALLRHGDGKMLFCHSGMVQLLALNPKPLALPQLVCHAACASQAQAQLDDSRFSGALAGRGGLGKVQESECV